MFYFFEYSEAAGAGPPPTPEEEETPFQDAYDTITGIADLAAKSKARKLTLADLEGGTFTITNGGIYGSLLSTPIINPPQCGVLGMHSIQDRPVVVDNEIVIRDTNWDGNPQARPNPDFNRIDRFTSEGHSRYAALVVGGGGTLRGGHLLTSSLTLSPAYPNERTTPARLATPSSISSTLNAQKGRRTKRSPLPSA